METHALCVSQCVFVSLLWFVQGCVYVCVFVCVCLSVCVCVCVCVFLCMYVCVSLWVCLCVYLSGFDSIIRFAHVPRVLLIKATRNFGF